MTHATSPMSALSQDELKTLVGRAAMSLSRAALHAALSRAARIDRMVKGVAKGDVWDELLQLGLDLGDTRGTRAKAA